MEEKEIVKSKMIIDKKIVLIIALLFFLFGLIRFVGGVYSLSDNEFFQEEAGYTLLNQCFYCIFGKGEYGSPFGGLSFL